LLAQQWTAKSIKLSDFRGGFQDLKGRKLPAMTRRTNILRVSLPFFFAFINLMMSRKISQEAPDPPFSVI
jgi:hypothetical protein